MSNQRLHAHCAGMAAPFALPGTTRKYERSRPFVITHLRAELELNLGRKEVVAKTTLLIERKSPLDHELVLDAVAFDIKSIKIQGKRARPVAYEYDGQQIAITLPTTLKTENIEIRYRAKPQRGMYFLAPDHEVPTRPEQVWTQCQDEDARYFLPCQDKPHVKMTTEMIVKVPHGFSVLSNGRLVSSGTPRGRKWTYHFSMPEPQPSYLISLVAGHFSVLKAKVSLGASKSVALAYYVPKGREADGRRTFRDTPDMLRLFSKLTGVPYPFDSYSQVVVSDFLFGGMENTTATTLYEHVLYDKKASVDVTSNDLIAHELAHQWFGDLVTCRDWSHAWLNEGFATFLEHVERESRLGRDEYDYGVASDLTTYLSEASGRYKRAVVCRDYREPLDLFDRHLYEKGGLVLHMLRRDLGDKVFWSAIQNYLKAFAGGIVETNDLVRQLEESSGRSLEAFFDQWIYRPGHPDLSIKISYGDKLLTVGCRQTQRGDGVATFQFLLEIEIETATGRRERHQKFVTTANDALVVQLDKRPHWVNFDPELRVVGRIDLNAPHDMLRAQLQGAPRACQRWAAADALGGHADMLNVDALGKALAKSREKWMVRARAAAALGRVRGSDALAHLLKMAKTRHPKVRRAVAEALGNFREPKAVVELTRLCRADASYLVTATAARALGRTEAPEGKTTLVALLKQNSWADVIRAGALAGLARSGDESVLPTLYEWSAYGRPNRARRAAIAGVGRLGEGNTALRVLGRLLEDKDPHLRGDVVSALEEFGGQAAELALKRHVPRELDGRVARRAREALERLRSRKGSEKKLAADLESLKSEVTNLTARLAKLEGKEPAPRKRR